MTLSAATSLVYGLAGLLATGQLAAAYGVTLDQQSEIVVKFIAASYLGYATTNWLARHTQDAVARRAITFGNFTGWAVSLAVSGYALTTGVGGAAGWGTLAMQAIFTAGWGYYAFVRGAARQPIPSDAAA
jgi:hypothetical protein